MPTESIVTALGEIKNSIDAQTAKLNEARLDLNSKLDLINTKIELLNTTCTNLVNQLICERNFDLEAGEEDSVAYYLAIIAKLLKRSIDANDPNRSSGEESSGDSSSDSSDESPSEEETGVVDKAIDLKSDEIFQEFQSFTYGVQAQSRLKFQSPEDFGNSKEGQSFDFTRYFVTNWDVDQTKATEYVILGADQTSNISSMVNNSSVSRVTSWKDIKKVQTIVIVENTFSHACKLYFPTQDSVTEFYKDSFESEKKAVDYAVSKFQDMLGDTRAFVAVIPAESISQNILQSEYVEKAKLITPTYEYN